MRILVAACFMLLALVNGITGRVQSVTTPVKVGEVAPDFTLVDHHGNKQSLSDSKGKRAVVLVFYRGYW